MKNIHKIRENIYITSDEEIKEGDWFIRDGSIHKCFRVHKTDIEFLTSIDSVYCGSNTFWSKGFCKKIILTTDQDLIKDGIQAIDDEFLEWFVKNPSCEGVETIYEPKNYLDTKQGWEYVIIIPKEEPKDKCCEDVTGFYLGETCPKCNKPFRSIVKKPKQETLEEAAPIKKLLVFLDRIKKNLTNKTEILTIQLIINTIKSEFVDKEVKGQQERMYSEEEVLKLLIECSKWQLPQTDEDLYKIKKWFKQFRKK